MIEPWIHEKVRSELNQNVSCGLPVFCFLRCSALITISLPWPTGKPLSKTLMFFVWNPKKRVTLFIIERIGFYSLFPVKVAKNGLRLNCAK